MQFYLYVWFPPNKLGHLSQARWKFRRLSRWEKGIKGRIESMLAAIWLLPPVQSLSSAFTLPKTNVAPENGWLEDEFPFGMACFQVLC